MFAGIGTGRQLAFHGCLGEHDGIGDKKSNSINSLVKVVFDFVEITIVVVGNLGWDVTFADPVNIFGGYVKRADNRVEAVVNTLDDVFEVTLVLGSIGASRQFAFHGSFGEHLGVGNKGGHSINADVKVVLDLVEITIVVVGNPGWDVTFADPVNIFGGYVQRADNRVEAVVNTLDDVFEVTLVLGSIGASRQFAFHGSLGEHLGVGNKGGDSVDADVEVVLDFVEVTIVTVSDFGGHIAFGDPVDVFGGNIQGTDNGVEGIVDSGNNLLEIPLMFIGVSPCGKPAGYRSIRKHACVPDQGRDGVDHFFHRHHDAVVTKTFCVNDN